ncbi:SRPBCC family protein [Streptomyces sp. GC420]|uniref:SRPBCC family protein n=1 Tax=Streptomyces sp. GC420 TaxID=2697568 RepID=UPI001415101D|nr:SRPBCC family protein [Streptomyces sp. GC420]NBM16416.1 polyketide cyclase [Streptomyces sp. GC420]
MDWTHYRFRSVWDLAAPPSDVFAVLARAEDYPRWWPQFRRFERAGGHCGPGAGTVRVRSLLPYDLLLVVRERRRDPAAGILEVALDGDVEGWARWTVAARGGAGTRALYEQEVVVRKKLLRRLAVPGRPFFRANHALMMRRGQRGLAALLGDPPDRV